MNVPSSRYFNQFNAIFMRIAFFSFRNYEKPFYEFGKTVCHFFSNTLNYETRNLALGAEIISCFVNDKLDARLLKVLAQSGLKLIALRCAGFNNVDLIAAKELDIQIVRVPAYSPFAVAEHAVALLLCLNRKIHKAYNRVRKNNFSIEGLTGFDLHNSKVGVIGTGKIGQAFCRIMLGFGAEVIAFDPYPNSELQKSGVQYFELEKVLSDSKIISLHLPLIESTRHIINKNSLAKMQNGVLLINTSRGGLVDTKAVIKALKSGKVGALALDVYEEEEGIFFVDHSEDMVRDDDLNRLMTFHNVLITSHQAFLTNEALFNIAQATIKSITAFQQGKELINAV